MNHEGNKYCLRVLVFGTVQGVGFRYHTCEQAKALGVCGWVRNRSDGSVEMLIAGNKEQLEAMKAWLSHGPQWATVDDMQATEDAIPEDMNDFTIR